MHGSAAQLRHIVVIASLAVIDVVAGRGFCVDQRPIQQIRLAGPAPPAGVAQHVRHTTDAQGANGIDKEGLAAIERVDVAEAIQKAESNARLAPHHLL